MEDELDIEETLKRRKLVEPKRRFWDAVTFGLFALLPIILFFLINSYQFEKELTFLRILWIIYLNGIVGLLVWLLIKGRKNMKALDKISDFTNHENAKSKVYSIISELDWELVINHDNYLRARAWDNMNQATMVTLVFTPSNELLINGLGDDSGTFQRFRFGLHVSTSEHLEKFEKKWNEK